MTTVDSRLLSGLASTLFFAGVLLSGCSEEPASRDASPSFTLDTVPLVHLRDETGEIFQILRSGTRLPDGTLVLADQYAARLHFFGPDGTFQRSVGERGEGPGEFNDIRWVATCASDSLFVWDYMARKVIVFDRTGAFQREFHPQGAPHELACTPDGTIAALGLPAQMTGPSETEGRSLAPVWFMDSSGSILDTIPHVPLFENKPLGRMTRITVSSDRLFVGTADSASVDVFDRSGHYVGSVSMGLDDRAPDQANYDAAIESMLSVAPMREIRDRFRAMYREIPMPDQMPPYFDLRTDPFGVLWAVVSGPGDPTTILHAVSPSGDPLGAMSIPGRVQVFEVGANHVLGALLGADDVQDLVLYHFDRAAGSGGT